MENAQIATLITALIKRSEEGTQSWAETADENVFQTSLRASVIQVGEYQGYNDFTEHFTYYELKILNESGRVVFSILYSKALEAFGIAKSDFAHLFTIARSKALHVEETMDSILKELTSDKPLF